MDANRDDRQYAAATNTQQSDPPLKSLGYGDCKKQQPDDPPDQAIGIDRAIDVAQWRYDPDAEQFAVGASANIENVSINGFAGQYVKGMWVPAPEPCDEDCVVEGPLPAPGDTEHMRFSWNADVSIHVVRWQEGDMVYQVLAGGDEFTKDEVLKIAQSLR